MYKKITHTIIEEHFDCPEAVNIANEVANADNTLMSRFRATPATPIPADQFRALVQDWFLELDARLQNLLNATYDPTLDYEQAIEDAFLNADELGNVLKGYYGIEFGERFSQNWRAITMNLLYIWRNIKNGWDYSIQVERLQNLVATGMGFLLNQFNNRWDRDEVKTILDKVVNSYINIGTALAKKQTSSAATARTQLALDWAKFYTQLSEGVIAQYPDLFTQ
jgi:hypothetical protein